MTLNQLHKKIGKMLAKDKNLGRRKVCVAKETFRSNLESDGCTILDAYDIVLDSIRMVDGDGFTETTKSGQERYVKTAILVGGSYNPNPGPNESHYSG